MYISSSEAAFGINKFKMSYISHTVIRLSVHLENKQTIDVKEDFEISDIMKKSTLMAWFKLNEKKTEARQYLYIEIPKHYKFEKGKRKWKKRKRNYSNRVIARMYPVDPKKKELFYLRMLLQHVRGATSFENIRKVNGIQYDNNEKACRALGLIPNDEIYFTMMEEVSKLNFPNQLRQFFVSLCVSNDCVPVNEIWEKFATELSADFLNRLNLSTEETLILIDPSIKDYNLNESKQRALKIINKYFQENNTNNEEMGLPKPINDDLDDLDIEILRAFHPEQEDNNTLREIITTLNDNQLEVFNYVTTVIARYCSDYIKNEEKKYLLNVYSENNYGRYEELINKTDKKGKLVFINGAGGCGKTYTYNAIIKFCEEYGVKYSCYAYTGIAASLLKNGKTLHHGFGLPIKFNGNGVCSSIIDGSFAYGELVNSLVMFIDEISMVSKPCIEFIDEYLKSIMNNNEPFGGKIIITGGDFRQILPVLPYAGRSEIIQNSIIKSEIWQLFKRFDLIINVRAGGNEEFANWQKDIGEHDKPVQLNVNQLTNNLLKSTFGNLFNNVNEIDQNNLNENDLETRAILTTTNNKARLINEKIIEKLPGEMKIYYSEDSIPNKDDFSIPIDQIYSKEFLARQNPGNLPPHELKLKLKTIVMLVRNINTSIGLCNGTRMSVERLGETTISCKVLTGPMKGRSISLPQMNLIPSDTRLPFPFQRKQFPIVPSFAMTINKSQGQSFNFVGVDLTDQVFSHGQLYVAVSRCRSAETLKFHVPIKEDMIPKNISSDVKKDIIKKLNDDNCDLKEILGENFTVSVKNVVYENVLPRNDNNDTH